jgi:GT2 family glycosyltransferase
MKFSVVIPTFNRPASLPGCLEALAAVDYPKDEYEVIVADDGSDDPLDGIVAPFRNRMEVSLARLPHRGLAATRNSGMAAARGRFVLFIDDDCRCAPNWLRAFSRCFEETPDAMIGGKWVNGLPGNIYCELQQGILDAVLAWYNSDSKRAKFVPGGNLGVPAALYKEIGGCDESFPPCGGEDRDLCARWLEHGYVIRSAPEAVVFHKHHLSTRSFLRTYYFYGRGARAYHLRRASRGARWPQLGMYADLRNLLSPIARAQGLGRKFGIAGLMIAWQLANLTGYVSEWWRPSGSGTQ